MCSSFLISTDRHAGYTHLMRQTDLCTQTGSQLNETDQSMIRNHRQVHRDFHLYSSVWHHSLSIVTPGALIPAISFKRTGCFEVMSWMPNRSSFLLESTTYLSPPLKTHSESTLTSVLVQPQEHNLDWFPRMRAMSLVSSDAEGEQNEIRNLQEKLESTMRLVANLSGQLTELKEQVCGVTFCWFHFTLPPLKGIFQRKFNPWSDGGFLLEA